MLIPLACLSPFVLHLPVVMPPVFSLTEALLRAKFVEEEARIGMIPALIGNMSREEALPACPIAGQVQPTDAFALSLRRSLRMKSSVGKLLPTPW